MRRLHERSWPDVLKRAIATLKPVLPNVSTERLERPALPYEQAVVDAVYQPPTTLISRTVLLNVDVWSTNVNGRLDYGKAWALADRIRAAIEGDLGRGVLEATLTGGPNRESDTAPLPDYLSMTFTLDVTST